MGKIKYVAMDIYGTVLAIDDPDNGCPPRKGIEDFFDACDNKGVKIVSASDADMINLKIDLKETGVDLARFYSFMRFPETPKDFKRLLDEYNVPGSALFVIGDNPKKDIEGAIAAGSPYFHVPCYKGLEDYNLFDLKDLIPLVLR